MEYPHFLIEDTSSIRVHFPASYVRWSRSVFTHINWWVSRISEPPSTVSNQGFGLPKPSPLMLHLWASWMEGVGGQNVSVGGKGGLKYSGYNEMYNIYVYIYMIYVCVSFRKCTYLQYMNDPIELVTSFLGGDGALRSTSTSTWIANPSVW